MSKIFSSNASGAVCEASSLPMRRCAIGALVPGNERIGGFVDAVVRECVGAIGAQDEAGKNGLPQSGVDILVGAVMDLVQRGDLGDVAETGQQSQRLLRGGGQSGQLGGHQIRHIVGEALGPDPRHVPCPGGRGRVECQQLLLGQRDDELDREERIAAGLCEHQFGQRLHLARARCEAYRR